MKRVLIIGGSGFIGSHIIDECISKEWEVVNLDTTFLYINIRRYQLDISKLGRHCYPELDFQYFDYIFHLAAVSDINECLKKPIKAIEVNIVGLGRVLERIKCDCNKVKKSFNHGQRFIYSSSMYVYNSNSGPYGITKRAAEELVKWYQKEHGINYTILRYGSIYGPGADDNNSMTRLIKSALKTGVISYYGTGEEVREYVHVKDLAKITVELAYTSEFENTTINLTGKAPMKASDMCYMLRDILGNEYKVEFRGEEPFNHYRVTPYKYQQEVSKGYLAKEYYDMGAGLLELITELDKKE